MTSIGGGNEFYQVTISNEVSCNDAK